MIKIASITEEDQGLIKMQFSNDGRKCCFMYDDIDEWMSSVTMPCAEYRVAIHNENEEFFGEVRLTGSITPSCTGMLVTALSGVFLSRGYTVNGEEPSGV